MWANLLFSGVALLFAFGAFHALLHLRWVRRLPRLEALTGMAGDGDTQGAPIRCSVVVAVRDEAHRIEGTVRRLLDQRGVDVEIIAVDDRSSDGTREILGRLAVENSRVQVRRVDHLPAGWLGKCHACHLGARDATGEWILFTDADCWLKPDVLARALRVAAGARAEHVTLTPGVAARTLGARAWHLAFLTSLANWISGVNRDLPKAHLGLGAFNLVLHSAYRECGGYEALRLTVVDDVKLGLLLRRVGKRTRAFLGGEDVECEWGTTVKAMIKIMEKNYFAAADYRVGIAVAAGAAGTLLAGLVPIGLWTGSAAGWAAALSPLLMILPAATLARRLGWSFPSAALTPLIFPVMIYAMLNSMWVTLRQGGVRWRDTFYPLDQLRRENRRG